MGCVASRTVKDERISICKDRKKLMKQLMVHRKEFGDAQLGYLRALKNTGVTLRQFTESGTLEPDVHFRPEMPPSPPPPLPPSPPLPLPPSPPPPPVYSPDLSVYEDNHSSDHPNEKVIEVDGGSVYTPPQPPVPGAAMWEFWNSLDSSSPQHGTMSETREKEEEDYWADTNSEFMEDDDDEGESDTIDYYFVNGVPVQVQPQPEELSDETSSRMSSLTKDTADIPMIVSSNKSLAAIVRELDDYFLEASACVKDVAVLMDINTEAFRYRSKESKRNKYNSRKVFSALTWSWSSKLLQSSRDVREPRSGPVEPLKPGGHRLTLDKIYAEEQKLYNLLKKEEITKVERKKKLYLLQQQQEASRDQVKINKTRSIVGSLQSEILLLKQSISRTCQRILRLTNDELQPQLVALTAGLTHMWKIMYECHQVQNQICQQLNHIIEQSHGDRTTEYKRRAADQLKTEVTSWYENFCRLVKAQRDYVQAICSWSQLAGRLVDEDHWSIGPSAVHALSKEWLLDLDNLQDRVASEALKSFLSAILSIVQQQDQEVRQRKRMNKLQKKLQKESSSLAELEMKYGGRITTGDFHSLLSSKHPLSIKRDKVKVLKKQVDDEKAKYISSVKITRAMILNNFQLSLPHVFRGLMAFSNSYSLAIQATLSRATHVEQADGSLAPVP